MKILNEAQKENILSPKWVPIAVSIHICFVNREGKYNFGANSYVVSLRTPDRKSDTAHNGTAVSTQAST